MLIKFFQLDKYSLVEWGKEKCVCVNFENVLNKEVAWVAATIAVLSYIVVNSLIHFAATFYQYPLDML